MKKLSLLSCICGCLLLAACASKEPSVHYEPGPASADVVEAESPQTEAPLANEKPDLIIEIHYGPEKLILPETEELEPAAEEPEESEALLIDEPEEIESLESETLELEEQEQNSEFPEEVDFDENEWFDESLDTDAAEPVEENVEMPEPEDELEDDEEDLGIQDILSDVALNTESESTLEQFDDEVEHENPDSDDIADAIETDDDTATELVDEIAEEFSGDDFEEDWYSDFDDEPELIFFDEEDEYQLPEPDSMITIIEGEKLVISFDTSGWVYMGDLLESDLFQLDKRQNGLYSTTFTFSTLATGTGLLEFWSVDPLTDSDVYVRYEVTVGGTEVLEPEIYTVNETEFVEPEMNDSISLENESVYDTLESSIEGLTDELTEKPPKEFIPLDSIPFESFSSQEVTEFFSDADNLNYYGEEEMLYYEAKIREANTAAKDIKRAVYCYEQLVKKYPASKWWDISKERARYLRKYYYL